MQENLQTRKFYKADELASILGIKKFVIRTWESQFDLNRSTTQYSEEDLEVFSTIKELLYEKKLSPTAAKEQLPFILGQKNKIVLPVEPEPVVQGPATKNLVSAATRSQDNIENKEEFWNNLQQFKNQLLKIKEQLK